MKDITYATETRLSRREDTNEFFTPESLVEQMLDKIEDATWSDLSKTYIDPAAGNFNFIAGILKRKLKFCETAEDVYIVFSNIYATELMEDNVIEGKERLLRILSKDSELIVDVERIKQIMDVNLVCADFYKWDYEHWHEKSDVIQMPLF